MDVKTLVMDERNVGSGAGAHNIAGADSKVVLDD
jgi:hypothetical protein